MNQPSKKNLNFQDKISVTEGACISELLTELNTLNNNTPSRRLSRNTSATVTRV